MHRLKKVIQTSYQETIMKKKVIKIAFALIVLDPVVFLLHFLPLHPLQFGLNCQRRQLSLPIYVHEEVLILLQSLKSLFPVMSNSTTETQNTLLTKYTIHQRKEDEDIRLLFSAIMAQNLPGGGT